MSKLLNVLNELTEVNKDGQNGYDTASQGVKTASLKLLFEQYSKERLQFATDLQNKIESLGQQPQEEGSIKSTLHRAWINIKSLITGGNEEAILMECLNGDQVAIDTYEKNLKEELPSDIRFLINDQLTNIRAAYGKLKQLEHVKK